MTSTSLTTLALALLLTACKPVTPSDTPAPTTDAVALLDGQPLSRALLNEIARQQTGATNPYDAPTPAATAAAASAPPIDRQRRLDELIDVELLAHKARERGLERQAAFQAEDELQTKTILAQAMVREQIAGFMVSDAELAAAYEERVPPHLFKLAQILVADEAAGRAVIEQLKQGQPFAELARRHSIDTETGRRGGSLGSLMMDQLPTDMAAAIRHLQPGQYTAQPVRSPQGWHVLLVQGLEPRPERPTLETARAWLHPQIVHTKVEAQQKLWRQEARVQLAEAP